MKTTLTLSSGRVVDVDADFFPGCPQTRTDPGACDSWDFSVYVDGKHVETTPEEDDEIEAALFDNMSDRYDRDRAAREVYFETLMGR